MIDRRNFLKTGIGAASVASVAAQTAESDLNVLFVAVDDLRPDLGCYGNESIRTPNIDRLASRSLVFERAYCQAPVCGPSRASLLTGLRPDTTRVWGNRTHFRETAPDAVTLPQQFKQAGYFTKALGKILHGKMADAPSWSEPAWPLGGVQAGMQYVDEERFAPMAAAEPERVWRIRQPALHGFLDGDDPGGDGGDGAVRGGRHAVPVEGDDGVEVRARLDVQAILEAHPVRGEDVGQR